MREARGLGTGLVISDQFPSLLSPTCWGAFTKMVMGQSNRPDMSLCADNLLLATNEKDWLAKLPVGHAIVKLRDRFTSPFLIRFPLMEVSKEMVTEDMIRKRMEPYLERFKAESIGRGVFRPEEHHVESSSEEREAPRVLRKTGKLTLNEREKLLLTKVVEHPYSFVSKHYSQLGWSAWTGNLVKDTLVKRGYIQIVDIALPTARVKLLDLTQKGIRFLETVGIAVPETLRHGGIEHRFWVHALSRKSALTRLAKKKGLKIETEYPIGEGKTVDIVLYNKDCKIAVEIETGKADAVGNIRKCLEAGFRKVLSVATNTATYARLKKQVEKLDIPPGTKVLVLPTKKLLR